MRPAGNPRRGGSVAAEMDVPGGRLAYDTAGDGAPVLFIHSAIADRRMWDREIRLYSSERRAVRFDLRGFGGSSPASGPFSYTEDIRSLLAHLRIPRAYLVGSSMGGAFAIDFALEHPEMVAGLFLVAPGLSGGIEPPFDAEEQAALEYDDAKSREVAQAWSEGDARTAFDRLRQLWCAALKGPGLELFQRMVQENSAEVFSDRSAQLATRPPPAAGRLSSIPVRTTVLVGDQDNPSSACFAKRIARAIPHASLETVPGADHLINLSRPDAFDRALRGALSASG